MNEDSNNTILTQTDGDDDYYEPEDHTRSITLMICATLIAIGGMAFYWGTHPEPVKQPSAQEAIQIRAQQQALDFSLSLQKLQEQIASDCVKNGGLPIFTPNNIGCGAPAWNKKEGK